MQVVSDLDRRIGYVYDVASRLTNNLASQWFELSKWGVDDNNKLELLKEFGILYLYLGMLEWKAYEQNTFFLEHDEDNCPIYQYPSTVADEETIKCLIDHFLCQKVDIRLILRKFGVYPLGEKPDGIDYMHIDTGNPPCDNRLFQIDKPYGEDSV